MKFIIGCLAVYAVIDIVLTILFCIKVKRCGNSLTDLTSTLRSFVTKYEYHHYDDNIEDTEYEDITNINDNE